MASDGPLLLYLRLFGFTAGTVLFLFLLILLLGYRRRRVFERVLFLVAVALFLFYSGGLLTLNIGIHYEHPPELALTIAQGLQVVGLILLPPLLLHSHAAYAFAVKTLRRPLLLKTVVAVFYLPVLLNLPLLLPGSALALYEEKAASLLDLASAGDLWLCAALTAGSVLQFRFSRWKQGDVPPGLHRFFSGYFLLCAAAVLYVVLLDAPGLPVMRIETLDTAVEMLPLVAGAVLGYQILRRNLFGISVQRNLVYVVTGGFLAVLYLTVVDRIGELFEPFGMPPVATTSILVFVLVFLFEPLQRAVGRALERALHSEVAKVRRVMADIEQDARGGDLYRLVLRAEERVAEEFSLAFVRLVLAEGPERPAAASGNVRRFPLLRDGRELGTLEAYHHGTMLSGETQAALETLALQLPGAIDLCRLIQQKLELERELAERQRMALLGQMAASISHNLKNPLGSMKTLLQVQLEKPDLPVDLRKDCEVVVGEIDRLAAKLRQLLEYSRPVTGPAQSAPVDAVAAADDVVRLLARDAERRGVKLLIERPAAPIWLAGPKEAVSDVLQNVLVNAVEATPAGGAVHVELAARDGRAHVAVTDEGPGIDPQAQARIFQPFFTTKPSGTGLGLAIVSRRLAELGGGIECLSPLREGRGTRFTITLPLQEKQ